MLKKVLKILLIIFIILAVILGSVAIWQWKNIQSIMLGLRSDSGEIQKLRDENQEKLVEDVNSIMDVPLREMTKEEKEQIESGEATVSEIYQKIFEEKIKEEEESAKKPEKEKETKPDNKETDKGNNKKPEKEDKPQKEDKPDKEEKPHKPADTIEAEKPKATKDTVISAAMVELYKLQNEFNARAEATIIQGANYYESIKKHPQDADARSATISHFTPTVRAIESECDSRVETVVQKLEKDLKSIGEDTSVIGTIRATYANEKQLKLSYYSNKYLK